MSQPAKIRKAPMFVGLAAFGGAGVGALVGGVAGIIIILTMAINGSGTQDASLYSGFDWIALMLFFAFAIGAVYGAVPGAIGGFLLGLLFCFARNRWMGVVGGAIFGALTVFYLNDSWPALKFVASTSEIWGFVGLFSIGGAVAGALLTKLLFHLINQEPETTA